MLQREKLFCQILSRNIKSKSNSFYDSYLDLLEATIKYFLDENNIFQFEKLNVYEGSVHTIQGIRNKVNGTFLQKNISKYIDILELYIIIIL